MVGPTGSRIPHDAAADGNIGEPRDGGDAAAHWKELRGDVDRLLSSVKHAWAVERKRIHMRAVDAFFRTTFFLCILGFGLTASISAALLVVQGLRNAVGAWSGAQWVGELTAGIACLAVVVIGGIAVREHLRREILRGARRELARHASRAVESRQP
ncbi:MAG: hypothetical protein ACKVWV_02435 [Planctomycetota bacterium]